MDYNKISFVKNSFLGELDCERSLESDNLEKQFYLNYHRLFIKKNIYDRISIYHFKSEKIIISTRTKVEIFIALLFEWRYQKLLSYHKKRMMKSNLHKLASNSVSHNQYLSHSPFPLQNNKLLQWLTKLIAFNISYVEIECTNCKQKQGNTDPKILWSLCHIVIL